MKELVSFLNCSLYVQVFSWCPIYYLDQQLSNQWYLLTVKRQKAARRKNTDTWNSHQFPAHPDLLKIKDRRAIAWVWKSRRARGGGGQWYLNLPVPAPFLISPPCAFLVQNCVMLRYFSQFLPVPAVSEIPLRAIFSPTSYAPPAP